MKKIADWLFGMTPILIGMFAILFYLVLETSTLLHDVFPVFVRPDALRWIAAIALSGAFHLTVLNITVNHNIIPQGFAIVTAVIAAVVTAFFFDVINPERWQAVNETWVRDLIFSLIVGFCGFAYVFLFVKKYQQGQVEASKQTEIDRLQGQVDQQKREIQHLHAVKDELENQVKRYQVEATNARQEVKAAKANTGNPSVNGKVKELPATVACDFCQKAFPSSRSLANRKGYCTKKPEQCRKQPLTQETSHE